MLSFTLSNNMQTDSLKHELPATQQTADSIQYTEHLKHQNYVNTSARHQSKNTTDFLKGIVRPLLIISLGFLCLPGLSKLSSRFFLKFVFLMLGDIKQLVYPLHLYLLFSLFRGYFTRAVFMFFSEKFGKIFEYYIIKYFQNLQ